MKNTLILVVLFLNSIYYTTGQTEKPFFLAIQPGITQEKFYEKDEFDVNVVPIVLQFPVSKRIDLRFVSLANFHFGNSKQFSDIGIHAIAPIFFKKKEEINSLSNGFYVGPLLGLGTNLLNEHRTTTVGFESGYMFATDKRFSITLGLQLGGSHFNYSNKPNVWRQHFGFKANIGFWFRKGS